MAIFVNPQLNHTQYLGSGDWLLRGQRDCLGFRNRQILAQWTENVGLISNVSNGVENYLDIHYSIHSLGKNSLLGRRNPKKIFPSLDSVCVEHDRVRSVQLWPVHFSSVGLGDWLDSGLTICIGHSHLRLLSIAHISTWNTERGTQSSTAHFLANQLLVFFKYQKWQILTRPSPKWLEGVWINFS